MHFRNQTYSSSQIEIEKKQTDRSLIQRKQPAFRPVLQCTPKVTNRMRLLYEQYYKTKRTLFRPNTQGGQSKWIFKTELKVVSQPIPQKESQDVNNSTRLSKIKAYITLSQKEWQKESKKFNKKKEIFEQLVRQLQNQKQKRIKLKKKLVFIFIKKMRLSFLLNKLKDTNDHINELHRNISSTKISQEELLNSIKKNESVINTLKNQREIKWAEKKKINEQIALKKEAVQANAQKLRELSIKSLPNQKQQISCMFSIGIINQQLYVVQLKKRLKKEISSSELEEKKIKKDQKIQKNIFKASFCKAFNECISNRKIYIDCRNSEIIIFKIFTVIYIHCKSLQLKNITTIMSKVSYFSDQIKQIYNFPQFEKYMINLIERLKRNENHSDVQQENIEQIQNQLRIVCDERDFKYLSWILKTFSFINQKKYAVKIGHYTTLITLISKKQLLKQLQVEKQASLRIKLKELSKTSLFD